MADLYAENFCVTAEADRSFVGGRGSLPDALRFIHFPPEDADLQALDDDHRTLAEAVATVEEGAGVRVGVLDQLARFARIEHAVDARPDRERLHHRTDRRHARIDVGLVGPAHRIGGFLLVEAIGGRRLGHGDHRAPVDERTATVPHADGRVFAGMWG